jgi:hypothetical protein
MTVNGPRHRNRTPETAGQAMNTGSVRLAANATPAAPIRTHGGRARTNSQKTPGEDHRVPDRLRPGQRRVGNGHAPHDQADGHRRQRSTDQAGGKDHGQEAARRPAEDHLIDRGRSPRRILSHEVSVAAPDRRINRHQHALRLGLSPPCSSPASPVPSASPHDRVSPRRLARLGKGKKVGSTS